MRRIAIVSVAVFALAPASAHAVTNTVKLTARMQMLATPSASAPAPLNYEVLQDVDTDPGGQQPNATASTELFFAKQIESNATYFPTCTVAQLDNAPDVPAACRPAIVGNGFSTARAGQPGQPAIGSVREDIAVTLLNGTPAGQQWLLYLQSVATAPVYLRRAIPGTVVAATDPYGFAVRFDVPFDLQFNSGLTIAMTKLVLNIPSEVHPVTVDGTTYNASFLRIGSCDGSLPALTRVTFTTDGGYPGVSNPAGTVDAATTAPCVVGPGFPYYPPSYPPNGYPNNPPLPATAGSSSGGGGPPPDGGPPPAGGPPPGGGPPPAGGPGGPPPPPRINGPRGTITALVGADGSFTLRGVSVACPATGGACTVDVTATQSSGASAKRVLALAHFKLKAGHTSAVKLKLNKRGRKLLARKHSLKLTVRLKVREANGVRASHTFKVKIRPKKKHAH